MALNSTDLKQDLVDAIVANDDTLTEQQIEKMTEVFEKIAIAVTDQIKRATVNVNSGNGIYNVV